jgi:hypothetical protein
VQNSWQRHLPDTIEAGSSSALTTAKFILIRELRARHDKKFKKKVEG